MKCKIAITLDEDVLNKVKKLVIKEDRNISNLINKILKDYFEEKPN